MVEDTNEGVCMQVLEIVSPELKENELFVATEV